MADQSPFLKRLAVRRKTVPHPTPKAQETPAPPPARDRYVGREGVRAHGGQWNVKVTYPSPRKPSGFDEFLLKVMRTDKREHVYSPSEKTTLRRFYNTIRVKSEANPSSRIPGRLGPETRSRSSYKPYVNGPN